MPTVRRFALVVAALAAVAGSAYAKKAAAGRPAFKAGDPEALWIWSDAAGWHLRATTPTKKKHTFHGVIRSEGVSAAKGTRGLSARPETTDTTVRFDFELSDGIEGFDWKTTAPCITLELKIDEQAQPARVHIGEKSESPSAMPFDACQ